MTGRERTVRASNDTRAVDLTRGTRWEFRASTDAGVGAWRTTLAQALRPLVALPRAAPWPRRWRAFSLIRASWPVRHERPLSAHPLPPPAVLSSLPETLVCDGVLQDRLDLELDRDGGVDLAAHFGPPRHGRCAWLFTELLLPRALRLDIHTGADWWQQWFIAGAPVFDTMAEGNRSPLHETAQHFAVTLAAGRHHLAVRVFSGNGGWAFAATAATATRPLPSDALALPITVSARRVFTVTAPQAYAGLVFNGERDTAVLLNGSALPRPEAGMSYARIPGLPATLLRRGRNELTRTWTAAESAAGVPMVGVRGFRHSGAWRRLAVSGALTGLPAGAARLTAGPFLGWASTDTVSLSCRTELRCPVALELAGQRLVSPVGLLHRFVVTGLVVPGLPAARALPYRLTPGAGRAVRGLAHTLPLSGPFDLAIYSDPSPQPQVLAQVLARIHASQPDAALALGDLTSDGRHDELWNTEYDDLLPAFFRRTPHLWVMGNHEEGCPVFTRLFATPGDNRDWTTVIAGCCFIGIDGLQDWSAGSERLAWLDRTLAAARERFVVFANHYPAWSSTPHAALGPDGRPWQRTVREARETILPLLAQHRVSLYLNGHAHCYERSLPPEGVPCLTVGGAGGFLYAAQPDARTNPYAQKFLPVHHWCRLRILPDRLHFTAIDLAGTILDEVVITGGRDGTA